ncbi:MAG: hypothetical protein GOV01_02985, partial [Candidatus Altiarchaeota archaeon]|nr:hypothetical protein [Candidatus Altiarchaeota archaeon]
LPIMMDTAGPEIRITSEFHLENGLKVGDLPISPKIKLKTGDKLLIDDGLFEAEVTKKGIKCVSGGEVRKGAKVVVVNRDTKLPTLSKKDKVDLKFALKEGVDMIALSFTRSPQDIIEVNEVLEKSNALDVWVIPKIEHSWALHNLEDIIRLSDGVMVARGDLALYTPFQKVPLVQKEILKMCLQLRRPSIVATQILSSMVYNTSPTRAEVSDIVNAVLDGTDALMLSNETTIGKHPIRALSVLNKVIKTAGKLKGPKATPVDVKGEMARSAGRVAESIGASLFCKTNRGRTPRRVAKFRPNAPIFTVSKNKRYMRNLRLVWGVVPGKPVSGSVVEVEHLTEAPSIKVKYAGKVIARGTGYGIGKTAGVVGKEIKVVGPRDKIPKAKAIIYYGTENDPVFQKIILKRIPVMVTKDRVRKGTRVLVDVDLGAVMEL